MYEYVLYLAVFAFYYRRYYYIKPRHKHDRYRPVPGMVFNQHDHILTAYIPYYTQLSYEGRLRFVSRLVRVNKEIDIQGREDLEITDEIRILIAASVTQLTFGFTSPVIPFLKGVVVYPGILYSRLAGAWVKGLTIGNGVVFLSWADFLEGYKDTSDTYNLGLHEFTHILRFETQSDATFDTRLKDYFDEWEHVGLPFFMRLKSGEERFFREYGGVNTAEFFSVCVENFFEVPERFEKELPDLYYHLCFLLRQNPLNATDDYSFNAKEIEAVNVKVRPKLPVYEIYHSETELMLSNSVKQAMWFLLFICGVAFYIMPLPLLLHATQFMLIVFAIILALRWSYYKNYKSVFNKNYLEHFVSTVFPIISTAIIIYEVVLR